MNSAILRGRSYSLLILKGVSTNSIALRMLPALYPIEMCASVCRGKSDSREASVHYSMKVFHIWRQVV